MAKMSGITGTLSGKMGNAVFRVRSGQQVVAQYQPAVANPNTEAQQTARAKFKLITQLAAIMSPGIGTMGVAKRNPRGKGSNRNGFVQKNYGLMVADPSPEAAERVTIPMEKLQLTDSFRPIPVVSVTSTTDELTGNMENIPLDVASVRVVVVEYNQMNGGSQAAIREIMDVPVEDREIEFSTQVNAGENLTILTYGLIPSDAARAKVDFENIHTPADEDFISAVELQKMVSEGEMSVTMTSGVNVSIPSA